MSLRNSKLHAASRLKGWGYLSSVISVLMLGIVSLKTAWEDPLLATCLATGVVTAIVGMLLRWRSHRIHEQAEAAFTSRQV
ncbi:hypothetical protein [Sphingomonas sp.]|jgi:uncharacterized membrane protein|uniref:hypothetical protein n=1 Tax=Sphingomonas sp. TaxID=28214 RepID=UPI002ED771E4